MKVLIKEEISKVNGKKLLVRGGTIPVEDMKKNSSVKVTMWKCPPLMAMLWKKPSSLYAKTKNGQYIDTVLDKACFAAMDERASQMKNPFCTQICDHAGRFDELENHFARETDGTSF
ncbi:MAG: hypothetical protein V8Q36_00615 [Anaerotignum sp.]